MSTENNNSPKLYKFESDYSHGYKAIINGLVKMNKTDSYSFNNFNEFCPYYLWNEEEKVYELFFNKSDKEVDPDDFCDVWQDNEKDIVFEPDEEVERCIISFRSEGCKKDIQKTFLKRFTPKSISKYFSNSFLLQRGDVVYFGGNDYRNDNKLIFDGEQFQDLSYKEDEEGSVPLTFVVGDEIGDFNIGDFGNLIVHNYVNWLSKKKMEEVEFREVGCKIEGAVEIQKKTWKILFDYEDDEDNDEDNKSSLSEIRRKYQVFIDNYDNIRERACFCRDLDNHEEDNILVLDIHKKYSHDLSIDNDNE